MNILVVHLFIAIIVNCDIYADILYYIISNVFYVIETLCNIFYVIETLCMYSLYGICDTIYV